MVTITGLRPPRDAGVPDRAHRTSSAGSRPTTTTRWAGRTRWTRPTSGPSRSPRTSAARATAPSSTGPSGIKAKGEVRTQFHHVIDVAPTILEVAGLPEPVIRQRRPAAPDRRRQHGLLVRRREGRRAPRDAVLRDVGNRGIYHKGWTAVTKHRTPWETGVAVQAARVRRRCLGAVRHDQGLEPVEGSGEGESGEAARAAAAVADRGGEVQRAAAG